MFKPELMRLDDGAMVTNAEMWAKRREELVELFSRGMFGSVPTAPERATMRATEAREDCCAGHARLLEGIIDAKTEKGPFSFPIKLFLPTAPGSHPLMLLLNFRGDTYDRYFPAEEIIDGGFALAIMNYSDVATDDDDFTTGVAGVLGRGNDETAFGKISLWAWGGSRCVDALAELPEINENRIAVVGHSRLGKSALWCAVNDERVFCACANNSGCAGASLEAGKPQSSEQYEAIARRFPYWFCPRFAESATQRQAQPFDQHMLVAAMAPRLVCVGSASLDAWASPYHEQLSCEGASPAWEAQGLRGFCGPERRAEAGEAFLGGRVGYFLREGTHFLSRHDWQRYMAFMREHMDETGLSQETNKAL